MGDGQGRGVRARQAPRGSAPPPTRTEKPGQFADAVYKTLPHYCKSASKIIVTSLYPHPSLARQTTTPPPPPPRPQNDAKGGARPFFCSAISRPRDGDGGSLVSNNLRAPAQTASATPSAGGPGLGPVAGVAPPGGSLAAANRAFYWLFF